MTVQNLDQYGLPAGEDYYDQWHIHRDRADALAAKALDIVSDGSDIPLGVRAQVFATLAVAERLGQVAELIDDRGSDIRRALED